MFQFNSHALMFWIEIICLLVPGVMLMNDRKRQYRQSLPRRHDANHGRYAVPVRHVLGGLHAGENFSSLPTVPEMFVTIGIVAIEIMLYVALVTVFPILAGRPTTAEAH